MSLYNLFFVENICLKFVLNTCFIRNKKIIKYYFSSETGLSFCIEIDVK